MEEVSHHVMFAYKEGICHTDHKDCCIYFEALLSTTYNHLELNEAIYLLTMPLKTPHAHFPSAEFYLVGR